LQSWRTLVLDFLSVRFGFIICLAISSQYILITHKTFTRNAQICWTYFRIRWSCLLRLLHMDRVAFTLRSCGVRRRAHNGHGTTRMHENDSNTVDNDESTVRLFCESVHITNSRMNEENGRRADNRLKRFGRGLYGSLFPYIFLLDARNRLKISWNDDRLRSRTA